SRVRQPAVRRRHRVGSDFPSPGSEASGQAPQGATGQADRRRADEHARLLVAAGNLGREPICQELRRSSRTVQHAVTQRFSWHRERSSWRQPARDGLAVAPSSPATVAAGLYPWSRSPARTSFSKQRPSPESPRETGAVFSCRLPYRATRNCPVSDNPFRTYLPRTTKESVAFMLVIAVISVNTIPVVIGGLTSGFTLAMWTGLLQVMPALLVAVVAVVSPLFSNLPRRQGCGRATGSPAPVVPRVGRGGPRDRIRRR